MKTWVETHCPKLIVCVGKSYSAEYALAFADNDLIVNSKIIDDREFNRTANESGTLVVVISFMINPNRLTKNVSIQKFGDRISALAY